MKKKILCVLLTAVLACMMLAGCKKNVGTPEDNAVVETEETEEKEEGEAAEEETGYLFGYSCIDLENPYYVTLQKSIENELKKTENRLVAKGADSDVQTQMRQLQEFIDMGVDAVFLCPADWEEITPALEALKEADIPVINLDTQVKAADLVEAYIGSDNKNAGFICGEALARACPEGGKLVIMECPAMNSINERITGFEHAIANGGFEVLDRADVNGEKGKAYGKMKEFLQKHPKIDAVMCGNDQIAMGVLQAVEEAGRTDVKIYGVDGSPEIKSELSKENSPVAGTGAQSPIDIGKAAAGTGLAILDGKDYEKEVYVETFLIDKENVELYGADGWQ